MLNEAQIRQLFPELAQIGSQALQEKAVKAFQLAMQRGGWTSETVHLAPVTLNWAGCEISLVEHIQDVVAVTMMSFDYLSKYHTRSGATFDRDVVLCGALLHDIGKFTEFTYRDGAVRPSDSHRLLRHPLSGAILAAMAELPDSIVHLIAVHSFEGDKSYQSNESRFVRTLDQFVFDNGVCGLEKNH